MGTPGFAVIRWELNIFNAKNELSRLKSLSSLELRIVYVCHLNRRGGNVAIFVTGVS
jgi:hypothetical protein